MQIKSLYKWTLCIQHMSCISSPHIYEHYAFNRSHACIYQVSMYEHYAFNVILWECYSEVRYM